MAQKETLQEFVKNLPGMHKAIQQLVLKDWGKNTLLAMGKAVEVAPKLTGALQRSARAVRAKLTENGIQSAFIFGVPYAYNLETGKRNGKELEISTKVNPRAQKGYAKRGVNEQEPFFMSDIKRVISEVWRRI